MNTMKKLKSKSEPVIALKSPLKWAGGKRWITPLIEPFWQRHKEKWGDRARFVEPFAGSASLSFALKAENVLINDANYHLINFFKWLRRGLVASITPDNSEEVYWAYRQWFNQMINTDGGADSHVTAYLFYYLNRTCYNGLCRFNMKGEFNVPFGRYGNINYVRDFREYQSLLRGGWKFKSTDFSNLDLRPGDFVYCDPPYDLTYASFTADKFTWFDQIRLAQWAKNLADCKVTVVISNSHTNRVIDLYRKRKFKIRSISAPRRINSTGDRTAAKEIVAVRNVIFEKK